MFKILSLDGGGSKGVYTLGALKELELKIGKNLHEHFDLVYGTSTGSIIASLICLGMPIDEIRDHYLKLIPDIMRRWYRSTRSKALYKHAKEIFGDKKFDSFISDIGIVATNYDKQQPLIFKSNIKLAHGLKGSFQPGFGCKIFEAVLASCAAYPIFNKVHLNLSNQGKTTAIDGGFVANNPTLFAITDAYAALGESESDISVLSVGVGKYQEKPLNLKMQLVGRLKIAQLVEKVLTTSSVTNEQLSSLLFKKVKIVRMNEVYLDKRYATNMIEKNKSKLDELFFLGRRTFAKFEREFESAFEDQ